MIKCPFCDESDKAGLARTKNGKYWCDRCFAWFNDSPVNAKLADAALDSFPVGRYRTPEVDTFRAEFAKHFPSLSYEFIQTMSEIGDLGRAKYGENCIEAKARRGDVSRTGTFGDRIYSRTIAKHAGEHFNEYIDGVKHDVYKTRRHQLAAAAFNPMMEFLLAELKGEPCAPLEITNR